MRSRLWLAVGGVVAVVCQGAWAAPVSYTGASDGNWSAGANWSTGVEPGLGDDVSIAGSGTLVNLSAGEEAGSLMLTGSPNLVAGPSGSLTVAGTVSRLLAGQTELNGLVVTANRVVIDNTGQQGNSATLMARNGAARLTIGAGGLSMTGLIDGVGQRTARLAFRGSATPFITLQGDVTVAGHGQIGNASAFTNQVRLEGMRTFTVDPVVGGTGLNTTGSFSIAASTDVFEGSNAGNVVLANGAVAGGVIKAGASPMFINTASSYTLGTTVTAGILQASVPGALGSGNVAVEGGQLVLGSSANPAVGAGFIADTAALSLSGTGTVALNFVGTDVVSTFSLNGVGLEARLYSAATDPGLFSGEGSLLVTSVAAPVPESGVVGMLVLAAPLMRRRR